MVWIITDDGFMVEEDEEDERETRNTGNHYR